MQMQRGPKPKKEKKGAIKHPGTPGFKPDAPKLKPLKHDKDKDKQEGSSDAKLAD